MVHSALQQCTQLKLHAAIWNSGINLRYFFFKIIILKIITTTFIFILLFSSKIWFNSNNWIVGKVLESGFDFWKCIGQRIGYRLSFIKNYPLLYRPKFSYRCIPKEIYRPLLWCCFVVWSHMKVSWDLKFMSKICEQLNLNTHLWTWISWVRFVHLISQVNHWP